MFLFLSVILGILITWWLLSDQYRPDWTLTLVGLGIFLGQVCSFFIMVILTLLYSFMGFHTYQVQYPLAEVSSGQYVKEVKNGGYILVTKEGEYIYASEDAEYQVTDGEPYAEATCVDEEVYKTWMSPLPTFPALTPGCSDDYTVYLPLGKG